MNAGEQKRFTANASVGNALQVAFVALIEFTDDSGEQWFLEWPQ